MNRSTTFLGRNFLGRGARLRHPLTLLLGLWFAVVPVALVACAQLAAPTPIVAPPAASLRYGFQVDWGNNYQRAFTMVREAGFGWAKLQVRWADMEPARGQTDWAYLDQVVDQARKEGLDLLFSVTAAPRWARERNADLAHNGPPTDPKTYGDFVGVLAKRYKGKVAAYEIWNEQNLSRDWGGPGRVKAAEYVALLKEAYKSIKGADSAALVITGALTPSGNVAMASMGGELARDDIEYFREMYQAGMRGSFDAVGVHPGGFNNAPDLDPRDQNVLKRPGGFHDHRSFYFRNFELYHEVMTEQGDKDKQLWFTEFGWASGSGVAAEWGYANSISEQTQADYLVKAFQVAKGKGYVGAMFVWNLNFYSTDLAMRAFAVLNPDWSPRPAYRALASMAR